MNSETRSCQNCKKDFVIEPEDFNFYEKIKVPPPTWCPECRAMRRLIWRNERSLHHNKCSFSGKEIISMFAPETKLVIYDRDIWWSDKWNPLDYGQEYDFSKPFFVQFRELMSRIPLASLGNSNIVNSKYVNHTEDIKNCYLVYASMTDENVSYAQGAVEVRDSFDLYTVMKSEQCYNDACCAGLYKTHYSYDTDDSINSLFLTSCVNLQNCLGCVNLRHKSYCIFNKQYTKEEYAEKLKEYDLGSYKNLEAFKKKYREFLKTQPRRFANIIKSVNVTGDVVMNTKNSKMVFDIYWETEDCKYLTHGGAMKYGYDGYGMGDRAELLYEGVDFGHDSARMSFGVLTHGSMDTAYTYMCYSSKYLFGCIGLQKEEFCILNKKYSKERYLKLVPKIIEHMSAMPYIDNQGRIYKFGEFFPTEFSPFNYNETIAQEYYPLLQQEAEKYGFQWQKEKKRNYHIDINPKDLPDHIKDTDESVVDKVIGCLHDNTCGEQCTEAFKILSEELQFYKVNHLALPRLCPNCRHFQRLKQRNPLQLWHRQCMCGSTGSPQATGNHEHSGRCSNEFETSYAPERPEIVYCEKCYQAEVY